MRKPPLTRATIMDVAKEAEVSFKTVSRVINNQPNVKPAKRAQVMKAIEKLSYNPSLAARGLAGRRSFLIGMLYDNAALDYVHRVQLGVLDRCRREGLHLMVENYDSTAPKVENAIVSAAKQTGLDGIVLTPPLTDNRKILDALDSHGVHYVLLSPATPDPERSAVSMDETKGAYDITQYLISQGHTRIGFIKGHPEHSAGMMRYAGFRKAMAASKLPVDRRHMRQGYFTFESGHSCGLELLGEKQRPTAIFAANDVTAAGLIAAAHELAIRVPEDVSVVGFDDTQIAQTTWPPLTTIRQPIMEMAAAAVEILLAKQSPTATVVGSLTLPHKLVLRGSVAPR